MASAIDAYFVSEPHAAEAELDGSARVLYHAKDIWPHFISCVLVVTKKLVRERPTLYAKVVSPQLRQDEKVVGYVLTQPPDRVSYRMLTPTDEELQRIHDMAIKVGILEKPISMKDLINREFIPADIKPAKIDIEH